MIVLLLLVIVVVLVLALATGMGHLQIGEGDNRRNGTYEPKIGHISTLSFNVQLQGNTQWYGFKPRIQFKAIFPTLASALALPAAGLLIAGIVPVGRSRWLRHPRALRQQSKIARSHFTCSRVLLCRFCSLARWSVRK